LIFRCCEHENSNDFFPVHESCINIDERLLLLLPILAKTALKINHRKIFVGFLSFCAWNNLFSAIKKCV